MKESTEIEENMMLEIATLTRRLELKSRMELEQASELGEQSAYVNMPVFESIHFRVSFVRYGGQERNKYRCVCCSISSSGSFI